MRIRRSDSDRRSSEAQQVLAEPVVSVKQRPQGFDRMMACQVFEEDTTACHSEVDSSRLGTSKPGTDVSRMQLDAKHRRDQLLHFLTPHTASALSE